MFKKLKLMWLTLRGYSKLKEAGMKKGILSTEFWLTAIAIGIQLWSVVQGFIPAQVGAWIIAVLTVAWMGFRTIAKVTTSTKDDELVARIEALLKK